MGTFLCMLSKEASQQWMLKLVPWNVSSNTEVLREFLKFQAGTRKLGKQWLGRSLSWLFQKLSSTPLELLCTDLLFADLTDGYLPICSKIVVICRPPLAEARI